jgi:hypothetical protein
MAGRAVTCSWQGRSDVAQSSHSGVVAMRILCAWCCRGGQPGYLGEREPLDNPEPTHGVCARHLVQLLQSLPAPQSFVSSGD